MRFLIPKTCLAVGLKMINIKECDIMKTINIIKYLALIAVVISCNKELSSPVVEEKPVDNALKESIQSSHQMTFKAFADNELETKTSLDGYEVTWAPKETIYVFDGAAPHSFTSDNNEPEKTVNFTGSAYSAAKYYAVYPYGTINGMVITTEIPTFQVATAGSFAPKANTAVAMTESNPTGDNVLKFNNVGAVVKFRLSNSDVRKVRLDAIGGEKISGLMTVTYDGSGSFTTAMVDGKSQSCVIMTSETNLSTSSYYYFVVNPTTYASGLRITLFKEDGSYKSISNKTSNTLAKNELMDFGTLPEITTWNSTPIVFNESFSYYDNEGGNDGKYSSGSGSFSAANCDESGWTYSGNVYTAKNCVRVGKNAGTTFSTRALDLSEGTATVEFRAALFGSDGTTLSLSVDNGTISPTSVTMVASTWKTFKATITGGTSATKITFSPDKRCFLDDIVVTGVSKSPTDPEMESVTFEISKKTPSDGSVDVKNGEASFTVHSTIPWALAVDGEEYVEYLVSNGAGDDEKDVSILFEDLVSGSRDITFTVIPSLGDPIEVPFYQSSEVDIPSEDISKSAGLSGTINGSYGYKLGTSSAFQTITIAKGYKTVVFYAAGWTSGTNTFSFTNGTIGGSEESITITNDSKINSTDVNAEDFSVTGVSGTKYTIDVTSTSTPVTISMKRGVIWGFKGSK